MIDDPYNTVTYYDIIKTRLPENITKKGTLPLEIQSNITK